MKIVKKKGGKFRIEHNKKLFWIIILLIIILGFLIYVIAKNNNKEKALSQNPNPECSIDSNCVAVCGCHPESCIPKEQRGECPNMFCSQVCSGPLDCRAGSCGCVKGMCEIINIKSSPLKKDFNSSKK